MGERTAYRHGTFCWADLSTTDPVAALEFYGSLFGWDSEAPVRETAAYHMLLMGDLHVGGLSALRADQRAAGVPPHWLSYVAVDDADTTAERAAALGGTVPAGPFDVLDAGRTAVVRDPQGAHLALWQAGAHPGARLVNDPGAMCLNQLNTHDPRAAAAFYGALFGWDIARVGAGGPPYWGIQNAGALNGGMMALPAEAPPHWLVYFTTEDVEDAAGVIERLGGRVVVPPMRAGAEGRILVAGDPQGAHFALWEGRTDP